MMQISARTDGCVDPQGREIDLLTINVGCSHIH